MKRRSLGLGVAALLVLGGSGCDPAINVFGSFFPAWAVCLLVGGIATAGARALLAAGRLEPHLGPPLLVYPALAVLLTMLTWLLLFRT